MLKIALISYKKEEKFNQGISNDEDADLIQFLTEKGIAISSCIWNDSQVDWSAFNVAIIKSPWDYHNHLPDFIAFLEKLKNQGIQLLNPLEIIEWNSHKKYLKSIAENGLPVIPSEYLDKGTAFNAKLFRHFETDKLVVKPCISAGAQNTLVLQQHDLEHAVVEINKQLQTADHIVQPFIKEIEAGEWSFIFFNGKYSHCSLKTPKQDDFRVQHYHGGTISYPSPLPLHIQQAEAYVQNLASATLYARVDGVLIDNSFVLMELELIEPYLFLNGDKALLENYYQALIALIQ